MKHESPRKPAGQAMTLLALCCILSVIHFPAWGEMRETNDLRDLEKEVSSHTLVCLDLDNTTMRAAQMLGSDAWWDDLLNGFMAEGLPPKDAAEKTYGIWLPIQKISRYVPTQPDGPALVRGFQDRKILVMGLTARPASCSSLTSRQLASIGVDLRRSAPRKNPLDLMLKDAARYENGILFVGEHNSKGEALKAFLAATGLKPEKIVFADDKKKHIVGLEQVFGSGPIAYVGFRYGGVDDWAKKYDRGIAEIQRKYAGRILPDDAAARLEAPSP